MLRHDPTDLLKPADALELAYLKRPFVGENLNDPNSLGGPINRKKERKKEEATLQQSQKVRENPGKTVNQNVFKKP